MSDDVISPVEDPAFRREASVLSVVEVIVGVTKEVGAVIRVDQTLEPFPGAIKPYEISENVTHSVKMYM